MKKDVVQINELFKKELNQIAITPSFKINQYPTLNYMRKFSATSFQKIVMGKFMEKYHFIFFLKPPL